VGLKLEDFAADCWQWRFSNWRTAAERLLVSIDISDVAFS
jgi:hypothetical protein